MPDRNFEIDCSRCGQTLGFTVRREGVAEVSEADARSALAHPGQTDPTRSGIILGDSPVKNICTENYPYGHSLITGSLTASD